MRKGFCVLVGRLVTDVADSSGTRPESPGQLGLFGTSDLDASAPVAPQGQDKPCHLAMPGAEVWYDPCFFTHSEADTLLAQIEATVTFQIDVIHMYGKPCPLPRETAWFGDPGRTYRYSGIQMTPSPWNETLQTIRARVEERAGVSFNSVLLNRYRDGKDKVAWHADDEPDLGPNPVIASVSLGGVRAFKMRWKHRQDRERGAAPPEQRIELAHGSLLIMGGETQSHWEHEVPATARPVARRINLTFRRIGS